MIFKEKLIHFKIKYVFVDFLKYAWNGGENFWRVIKARRRINIHENERKMIMSGPKNKQKMI